MELSADRFCDPIMVIENRLLNTIKTPWHYDYIDIEQPHPNDQTRIKTSLTKAFVDNIVGMNGEWDNSNKPYFIPNNFKNSPEIIKKRFYDKLKSDQLEPNFYKTRITEKGDLLINYFDIWNSAEDKVEELMETLNNLVKSEHGFEIREKDNYLKFINNEIAKFKTEHPPKFLNPEELPVMVWVEKIINREIQGTEHYITFKT